MAEGNFILYSNSIVLSCSQQMSSVFLKTSGGRRAHPFLSKLFQCLTVSAFIPWECGIGDYPKHPNLKLPFSRFRFVTMNSCPSAWDTQKFLFILQFPYRSLKAVPMLSPSLLPLLLLSFLSKINLISSLSPCLPPFSSSLSWLRRLSESLPSGSFTHHSHELCPM